jgi:peptidoglycan hydrolase-like protein with peptidoglycan-binding domain
MSYSASGTLKGTIIIGDKSYPTQDVALSCQYVLRSDLWGRKNDKKIFAELDNVAKGQSRTQGDKSKQFVKNEATGKEVKLIQDALQAMNLLTKLEKGKTTETYGSMTAESVTLFQQAYGNPATYNENWKTIHSDLKSKLPLDKNAQSGAVDQWTLLAMDEALMNKWTYSILKYKDKEDKWRNDPTLTSVAEGKAQLKLGAKGDAVKLIQNALIELGVLSKDETEEDESGKRSIKLTMGTFDVLARRAVETFQVFYEVGEDSKFVRDDISKKQRPLSIVGHVGKNTILSMDEALINGWKYEEEQCCFPLEKLPHKDERWTSDPRCFGANRPADGRAHAGCDLYQDKEGIDVFPVRSGRVIEIIERFTGKEGSNLKESASIAIHHGRFTVRYCELDFASIKKSLGNKVEKDKSLGKIKQVAKVSPMLHFEMYSNICMATSGLSQKGNNIAPKNKGYTGEGKPFSRRDDLMNPAKYLSAWQDSLANSE